MICLQALVACRLGRHGGTYAHRLLAAIYSLHGIRARSIFGQRILCGAGIECGQQFVSALVHAETCQHIFRGSGLAPRQGVSVHSHIKRCSVAASGHYHCQHGAVALIFNGHTIVTRVKGNFQPLAVLRIIEY